MSIQALPEVPSRDAAPMFDDGVDKAGSTKRPKRAAMRWHGAFIPVGIFLVAFGLFNFAELPLGWKDRTDQITRYLDATAGLGAMWVDPALWAMKGVECALGVIALAALLRRDSRLLSGVILGWMALFTGFVAVDIWAADRAELQEHTVYFIAFTQLLVVVLIVGVAQPVLAWVRARTDVATPGGDTSPAVATRL